MAGDFAFLPLCLCSDRTRTVSFAPLFFSQRKPALSECQTKSPVEMAGDFAFFPLCLCSDRTRTVSFAPLFFS